MGLIRKIKAENIKYIYYGESLSPKLAQTIASEAGAGLLPLSGLHNVAKSDLDAGATFISLMYKDLENLKKGMECR